ncbi:AraC-like ligand-binding domain-containing protein [Pseudonocardia phyllosphaerae]|uniref:AraC-like ligand-binding domain-containing protein n=1 Tax=Pseudonocardia phyllosphaerae TaxID=3390502 RepID=UPI00397C6DAD
MGSIAAASTHVPDEWQSVLSGTFVPLECASAAGSGPGGSGSLRALGLDGLHLADVSGSPQVVRRSQACIRAADPAYYKIGLQLAGTALLEQDGREARLGAGDFALYDTLRPYRLRFDGPFRMLVLMFPRTAFPMRAGDLRDRMAVPVRGADAVGGMVGTFLTGLTRLLDHDSDAERLGIGGGHLGPAVLNSLAAVYDDTPHRRPAVPEGLLHQVRAYIEDHLDDPDLGPERLAAAHHVSVRYLHRLFEAEGETVAGRIRARRLEHCRRDLCDPALRSRPVSAVAARWGLLNPAHFSRAFRATYGVPPTEYRRGPLGAEPCTDAQGSFARG